MRITRVGMLLLCAFVISAVAHRSAEPAQRTPQTSRIQTSPTDLRIDLVALDRDGAPLTDLAPDDIEIWISGFRVPITEMRTVTPEVERRTVVLLLDNTAVDPVLAQRVKETARLFVNRIAPGDRMAVVPLHGDRMPLTDDEPRLRRAVESYYPQGFPFRLEDAGEHVLRTLTVLSRQLLEEPGRKAIVAIGVGWMFDAPVPPAGLRDLRTEWIQAIRAAGSSHASLYVIDPSGVGAAPGISGSTGLARDTGGQAFLNTNDPAGAVARIWAEAGTYYLLRVADPPSQRTADLRELDIKTVRRNITIRARRLIPGSK